MPITAGTRFGSYQVGEPIGAGGMGEVYRATDTNLKREVALKVLPESFVTDENRLARLQREAEVLAALNHPNVAQIYGFEQSGERSAIVMELIDGQTLDQRIAKGPLPPGEAIDIALQIAAGLEAAHEQNIVHRDLKPANIVLKADGSVKVLDFGIAKALELRAASGTQPPALTTPAMTEAGVVLGTAGYMSPEQARGKPVDKRADIWAFGCVLYEMLTGQPAFAGDDVTTTLARVLERNPDMRPLPSELSPAVRGTLELCLQKDVKKRLRDIGDVRLALNGELATLAPAATSAVPPLWRRAWPVAASLLVGGIIAGAYVSSRVEPPLPAAVAPALPVTRFVITPPADAPLANLGGYDVTISPDGERIAYYSQDPETGVVALNVRELDALESRLVPGTEVINTGGGNMNPFFSADGRSIGLLSPESGVIRVAIDGAPPIKMLDAPEPAFLGATWTEDDTLVYSSGRSLYRISAGGGGTPKLLTDEQVDAFYASPVLLPGGHAVLFGSIVDGTESVAVLDLDTGEQKIVIEGGQNATYAQSGHIVFARGSTLMAAPFNPAELALTGEPVAMIQGIRHPNALTAADYAISDSGTLVYVPGGDESTAGSAIVWVDRAGNIVGRAVPNLVDSPRDPRLSPDGTRLLLTTGLAADGDLWVYDLGGRPPLPLAVANDNRFPAWSPDGRQVVFVTVLNGAELFVLPADGSVLVPQRLGAEDLRGGPYDWTEQGELFIGNPGAPDIGVLAADGSGDVRPVVATQYAEFDAALSPDGRWLAYVSTRTGRNEIWVQSYPDGVAQRVSANTGYEPRWSADGTELFYLQGSSIMSVAVETEGAFRFAPPELLFSGPYLTLQDSAVHSYDVASDGRFLMIQPPGGAGDQGSASIVVVQNWTEELRQRVPSR
jgi:Tol biopolymer transport system component/predicted Ser/Thr protein kinase